MKSGELNQHGQKMGRKGRETRQKIMNVALEMLEHRSYKDLTVAEVAQQAGVSSSTFYVYFEDIEDVLFACVQSAAQDLDELYDTLTCEWKPETLEQHVKDFIEVYNKLWDKYRVELRVRNLEADQGNLRFLNVRVETTRYMLQLLAKKIAQFNPKLKYPTQIAVVIHSAMGSLASQHEIGITSATRQTRKQLSAGIVEMICTLLKG